MSQTNIQFVPQQASVFLPVPKIMLKNKSEISSIVSPDTFCVRKNLLTDEPFFVECSKQVIVTVHGFAKEIMDNLSKYKLRLELLRYKKKSAEKWDNFKRSGFCHPSYGFLNRTGSHTHGGKHTFVGPNMAPLRQTEWDVTNFGQQINVTQGIISFLTHGEVKGRDLNSNNVIVSCLFPTGRLKTALSPRFPVSSVLASGKYRFRWSIEDLSDSRGQRLTGPESETVAVGNLYAPFIPDVNNTGSLAVKVNYLHSNKVARAKFKIGGGPLYP